MITWIKNAALAYGRRIKNDFTVPTRNWLIFWAGSLFATILASTFDHLQSLGQVAAITLVLSLTWLTMLVWICLMLKPIKEMLRGIAWLVAGLYRVVIAIPAFLAGLPALLARLLSGVAKMTARDWTIALLSAVLILALPVIASVLWPFAASLSGSKWLSWFFVGDHVDFLRTLMVDLVLTYLAWGLLFAPVWMAVARFVKLTFFKKQP